MDFTLVMLAELSVASWSFWWSALRAGLGLGFVIFVHELGHFLVAKACGVKCEKFYIGFDVPIKLGPLQLPSALFRKQWGETEYGIGILPLGGYVKMLGQDDNPANASKEAERVKVATPEGESGSSPAVQLDPRSFPAKPVWKRMAIISAGVIMNLIFAVIFAILAYRIGVSYTPCVIGHTSPGLSAWEVGLSPGDRILRMDEGKETRHLRFDKDMMVNVFIAGENAEMDLLVARNDDMNRKEVVTVTLSRPLASLSGRPAIGISPLDTQEVKWYWNGWQGGSAGSVTKPAEGDAAESAATKALKDGDRILAVDGQPVKDSLQLQALLAGQTDRDFAITVERAGSDRTEPAEQLQLTLPARPLRTIGLELEMGPVVAVRQGSPAARAGMQAGDRVVKLQGEPIGDPMTLPARINGQIGRELELVVTRGSGSSAQEVSLKLTPAAPQEYQFDYHGAKPVASYAAGFAFGVVPKVVGVVAGSPAAAAGLQAGDELLTVEFLPSSAWETEWKALRDERRLNKALVFDLSDPAILWPEVWESLQNDFPDTKLQLTYRRGDARQTAEVTPIADNTYFNPDRGVYFATAEEVHQVSSLGEAFALGVRETKEGVQQVFATLQMLISGRLSVTKLRGPVTIVRVAGAEASESTARLLIFLTVLSANLAVLNFLPIPVLDGGHALFLLYEGIFRRPVDERVAFGLTLLGFSLLMSLMVFVFGMDMLDFVPGK